MSDSKTGRRTSATDPVPEAVAPVPGSHGPTAPTGVDAGALMSLLTSLTEQVGAMQAELTALHARQEAQERATPQMRPQEIDESFLRTSVIDPETGLAYSGDGQDVGQRTQIDVGPGGVPLPKGFLERWAPDYKPGDHVALRLDAVKPGTDRTWGEILGRGRVGALGRVGKRLWFQANGHWKYLVRFPGLTARQGDGFLDSELQRAAPPLR